MFDRSAAIATAARARVHRWGLPRHARRPAAFAQAYMLELALPGGSRLEVKLMTARHRHDNGAIVVVAGKFRDFFERRHGVGRWAAFLVEWAANRFSERLPNADVAKVFGRVTRPSGTIN